MRVYVTNYDRRKFVVSVSPTATVSELMIESQNVYRILYRCETRIAAFKTDDGYDICSSFRVADVLEDKCRLVAVKAGEAAVPAQRTVPSNRRTSARAHRHARTHPNTINVCMHAPSSTGHRLLAPLPLLP
jgi:hypothetical protein